MRPAGAAPDTREIIITLITIRFHVSVRKTIKEINCIVSCPCFSVMVKDDRWQSIFTRAEQPHERISFGISFRLLQYLYSCLIPRWNSFKKFLKSTFFPACMLRNLNNRCLKINISLLLSFAILL